MFTSSLVALIGTLLAAGIGFVGIAWTRWGHGPAKVCWGRRLFFGVLAVLACVALVAAWQPQTGFLCTGLAIGGLLILMLWELPEPGTREHKPRMGDQDLLVGPDHWSRTAA